MRFASLTLAAAVVFAQMGFSQGTGKEGDKASGPVSFPKGIIYFTQKSGKKVNLFSMKSDGSGLKQLTDFEEWVECQDIDVNPKSKHVVFTYREKMSNGLGTVDLKTGKLTVLIKPTFDETTDGCALSPDGKQIAVSAGAMFKKKLYLMSVTGSGKKSLTKKEGLYLAPAWSPDGKLLTVNHKPAIPMEGGGASYLHSEIIGISAASGKTITLAGGEGSFDSAQIAPGGKAIVYVAKGIKSKEKNVVMMDSPKIWTMRINGKDKKQISDGTAWDTVPTWSPDGKRVAFISTRDGGYENVFVMTSDGSDVKQLSTQDYSKKMMPRWSRDGNFLFFVAEKDYKRKGHVVHIESGETRELVGDCQEFSLVEKSGR